MRAKSVFWEKALRRGTVALAALMLVFLISAIFTIPAPSAAEARPTLTPSPTRPPITSTPTPITSTPTPTPVTPIPSTPAPATEGLPGAECASICGRVINVESNAGEAGQIISFGDANGMLQLVTDASGDYAYGRLGAEVGFLNVLPPTGSGLHPLTSDIPVAPVPGWAITVNLGVARSVQATPPLIPTAQFFPAWVQQGGQVTLTVQVENRLPTKISGVRIVNLLPQGLNLSGITTDRGDAARAGNYATAFIGDLAPGEIATVRIFVDVAANAANGAISDRVSLVYREYVASQATATVNVGQQAVNSSGSSGSPTFALLPSTGLGLTAAAGAGLAMGVSALIARHIRKRQQRKKKEPSV